ncbi:MAG: hypothetical protein ACRDRX_14125 [Pseudonocardiaceae bacterium]
MTGSVAGGPESGVRGRGAAAGARGGAAPEASVPPPLFPPVEPVLAVSAEFREDIQWPDGSSASATRKRVVLLPHPDRTH